MAYAKFYVRPVNEKAYQVTAVAAFWVAYTITRPLGASFGDYLAVPAPYGDGLQLGTGPISLWSGLVLIVILAAVAVQYYRRGPQVQASPRPYPWPETNGAQIRLPDGLRPLAEPAGGDSAAGAAPTSAAPAVPLASKPRARG